MHFLYWVHIRFREMQLVTFYFDNSFAAIKSSRANVMA